LEEVTEMRTEVTIKPKTIVLTMDLFKLAEMMGFGYGKLEQAIFTLPAGTKDLRLSLTVPKDEVYYITFSMFGDIPSSSMNFGFERFTRTLSGKYEYVVIPKINLHEGWIGTPMCPPGWHRCDPNTKIYMIVDNVTGAGLPINDLPSQDIYPHITLFIFTVDKNRVKEFEEWILKMMGVR
jgi:hypothetical protein